MDRQLGITGGAVLAAVGLAWLSANPLAGIAWANLLLSAAVCIIFGNIAGSVLDKIMRLGAYGFALGFAFMMFGYTGSQIGSRFVPFLVIGIFCAVCAVALGAIVHSIRSIIAARH